MTRILSASGSMNLPKSVTSPRLRARYAVKPVRARNQHEDGGGDEAFGVLCQIGQMEPLAARGLRSTTTNTGTKHMRMSVTMFAGVHNFAAGLRRGFHLQLVHGLFAFHFVQQRIGDGELGRCRPGSPLST